jgi:hypothetical protein
MSNPRLKQLAQDGATLGQVVTWDGSVWAPATPSDLDTENQEEITTENITGTDTALADTLSATPVSNAGVKAYLNGVLQVQGAGEDYTIAGQTITWLAATGTAVDMDTADTLIVTYDS